jgi:hypothetical protein
MGILLFHSLRTLSNSLGLNSIIPLWNITFLRLFKRTMFKCHIIICWHFLSLLFLIYLFHNFNSYFFITNIVNLLARRLICRLSSFFGSIVLKKLLILILLLIIILIITFFTTCHLVLILARLLYVIFDILTSPSLYIKALAFNLNLIVSFQPWRRLLNISIIVLHIP